ncbi:MAG: DUF3465 domain-containing protein [Gemmatimonadetes bacterium]|nr:DUF3465 domain-containing protein [Gemmatimonadota bacterium]
MRRDDSRPRARYARPIAFVLVLLVAATTLWEPFTAGPAAESSIVTAERSRAQELSVEAAGVVTRLLEDDTEGSRHQRFIIRVTPELTVLVVHNIDLAPRVPVQEGDSVSLRGDYVWNDRGGLVHWTHHDPAGRHIPGWIEHRGRRYQ